MCSQIQNTNTDFIIAIIGILGTLLGTVLGWILNNFSNKGKLNIYVSSWNDRFQTNQMGVMVETCSKDEIESFHYEVAFDIYNSSGNPKIMRNIKIVFNDGVKDIIGHLDYDEYINTETKNIYNKVGPLNIPPKAVEKLKLHGNAWARDDETNKQKQSFNFIWNTKKIYLVYTNEKNKVKRKLIKSTNYNTCVNSTNGG